MKIVKYYRDNCPGCVELETLLEREGLRADKNIHAMNDMTLEERRNLKLLSVPALILFDDHGQEVDRSVGINPIKIAILFARRAKGE